MDNQRPAALKRCAIAFVVLASCRVLVILFTGPGPGPGPGVGGSLGSVK